MKEPLRNEILRQVLKCELQILLISALVDQAFQRARFIPPETGDPQ